METKPTVLNPTIHGALKVIDEKIAALGDVSESNYKTEGVVDGIPVNLKKMTTVEDVITLFGTVLVRANAYNKSQVELGVKNTKPFLQNGFSVEAFKHDCQFKIRLITSHETRKQLEEARAIVAAEMTEAERRAMNLGKASAIFEALGMHDLVTSALPASS